MNKNRRNRRHDRNKNNSYQVLEERKMLAVSAVFSGGELMVSLTEALDAATITTDDGAVRVNGSLVDTDLKMGGIQAAAVDDVTNLVVVGNKGLTDLSVTLDGFFDTGALQAISLNNINQVLFNGVYSTGELIAVLVGDDGSFAGPGQITVMGETQIQSADAFDITLENANNEFNGAVSISTRGNVSLSDNNSIVLRNIDVQNLTLSANVTITDSLVSSVVVPGVTRFTAASVDLGNNGSPVELFVVVSNTTGDFSLNELDDFIWAGNSSVGSANIQAGGLITNGPQANIEVVGDAFLAAQRLRLGIGGSNTFNTGRININTTGNAFIYENSPLRQFGNNSAENLDLIVFGNVDNSVDTVINVTGITSIQSSSEILIGIAAGDTFNTGILEFFGDRVNISEDSDTLIGGAANFANNLTIISNGTITDTEEAYIFIQGNATFVSAVDDLIENGGVDLGDSEDDFFVAGSISFDVTDGDFSISEDDGTFIGSSDGFVNRASAVNIRSTGNIVNGNNAIIVVDSNAALDGVNITIGQAENDNVQFGSLTVTADGNANVQQDNAVVLTGDTFVGGDFNAIAVGTVTDSSTSFVTVVGQAGLFGTAITVGDMEFPVDENSPGDFFDAGTLRFSSGGNVNITQDGNIVLAGNTLHPANILRLKANGNLDDIGTISNNPGADLQVESNLIVTAVGDITLGSDPTDVVNFANLNFSTLGNVTITAIFDDVDSGFFIFGDENNQNLASELRLFTNVDVNDGTNAVIDIDQFIRIEARNIILGDTDTDCVSIPVGAEFVTTDNAPVVTTNPDCPL